MIPPASPKAAEPPEIIPPATSLPPPDVSACFVNGKLMVKYEPSTHDPGWNNGKPGPIERFVAKHGEE